MESVLFQLVSALGAAGIIAIAALWFLRAYLDKVLETRFRRIDRLADTVVAIQASRLKEAVECLDRIQKIATYCRDAFRELSKRESPESIERLRSHARDYNETLISLKNLIPEDTWLRLHCFKSYFRVFMSESEAVGTAVNAQAPDMQKLAAQSLGAIESQYAVVSKAIHDETDAQLGKRR